MPAVRIARRVAPRARQRHPKMTLTSETGRRVVVPYAPSSIDFDGFAPTTEETDRAQRTPLLHRAGKPLGRAGWSMVVVRPDGRHVEDVLRDLDELAGEWERISVGNMGRFLRGMWRIEDLAITSERLAHGSNRIVQASVDVQLVRPSDITIDVGPVSGGTKPPTEPPDSQITHTVVPGDTLWALAVDHYGDGTQWTRIADANGVRDPRKLQVGTVLTIPPA